MQNAWASLVVRQLSIFPGEKKNRELSDICLDFVRGYSGGVNLFRKSNLISKVVFIYF